MSRRRPVATCLRIKSEGSCIPVHTKCSCATLNIFTTPTGTVFGLLNLITEGERLRDESRCAIWPSKKLRPPGNSTSPGLLCLSGCQNVAAVVRLQMPNPNLINFKLLLPLGSAICDVSSCFRLIPVGEF
jgi:hypothetical protein